MFTDVQPVLLNLMKVDVKNREPGKLLREEIYQNHMLSETFKNILCN